MRMLRITVFDPDFPNEIIYRCVCSQDDLNTNISYWLDHGDYSVTISKF